MTNRNLKFEKLSPAETMDRTEKIEENLQKYLAMLANSDQISTAKISVTKTDRLTTTKSIWPTQDTQE